MTSSTQLLLVVIPVALLFLGTPIFLISSGYGGRYVVPVRYASGGFANRNVWKPGQLPVARYSVFHSCRRNHGSRRDCTSVSGMGSDICRRRAGLAWLGDYRVIRIVWCNVRLSGRNACRCRPSGFPSLQENGYGPRFAVSLIASSGAIAIVIPPSIAMIIYGITAQVSLQSLFTAGILPAILIGCLDAIYVVFYARKIHVPVMTKASRGNLWTSTKDAGWALGTILVIFGGIYGACSRRPRRRAWRSFMQSS